LPAGYCFVFRMILYNTGWNWGFWSSVCLF